MNTKEQTRLQILNAVLEGRWSIREAAEILVVSERHAWRILAAYRKEGAAALAHGNRGRLSLKATPASIQQQVVAMAQGRYSGANHTHLTELIAEREGIVLSRSTVRRLLTGEGLSSPRYRRPPRHRCRRQRMPQEGMLLQLDGSHHDWLEGRRPVLTLLLSVDDATGIVPYALFREQEDTRGYFQLLQGIIQRRGIPLALYSDRHSVFRHSSRKHEEQSIREMQATQFGRALRELGIQAIFAKSPQAKGRVERLAGTFQDRLVTELRLAGANSLEEANEVLWNFLPRFNERFGVPAADPGSAYLQVPEGLDIEGVLCIKELRRVAKDNTVRYHEHTLQLYPGTDRTSYAGARIEVQERLDGRLLVCYRGRILTTEEAPPLAATLRTLTNARPVDGNLLMWDMDVPDPVSDERAKAPKRRIGLGWNGEWYQDDAKKRAHRELVLAGMERARLQGKCIGRPSVTEREGFSQRFEAVVEQIGPGGISRRQAARELAIGYATLKRLLDARLQNSYEIEGGTLALAAVATHGDPEACNNVFTTPLTKSLNT